jgi:hypothetical protein
MAKKAKTTSSGKSKKTDALRFAHPFFTSVPPDQRPNIPGVGQRMTDFVKTRLEPIPDPIRDPTMSLAGVIGNQGALEIEHANVISFHAAGDTGKSAANMSETVAAAMTTDYDINHPEKSPAFFLHLGDVIYYDNTDQGYHDQFYATYKNYPGKIIAIPGNHDGEVFAGKGQKKTLEAFMANFCLPKPSVPPAAGTIFREMVSQPGVYWVLNTPFIDIIGLYSNMAENPGYIAGQNIGQKQKDWLTQTLATIQKGRKQGSRKALLFAVHHPPFSSGGHGPSSEMLRDIDDACAKSGIMPDAVLAGHSHNYQRYTRFVASGKQTLQIPFVVAGTGGHHKMPVPKATGVKNGDNTFEKSLEDYGYLLVTATPAMLTIQFFEVKSNGTKKMFDKVSVDLKTSLIQ